MIIDYQNLVSFSFSFLHYRFSKCTRVMHWLQQKAQSGPYVNSLLIIYIACTRCTLSLASHPPSLQLSIVSRGPVVNWPAWTQCTYLFASVEGVTTTFKNVCGFQECLWITSQQLSHATRHYQHRMRETLTSCTSFRPCKAVVSRHTEI